MNSMPENETPGIPLTELTLEDLSAALGSAGHRPFVARQVMQGVYGGNARSFDEITTLARPLRAWLTERYLLRALGVEALSRGQDDNFKLALRLSDGHIIEAAYLADGSTSGGSVCVSSQVGCVIGCLFCASGSKGFMRNLSAAEMVEQVLQVRDHLSAGGGGRRVTHVTFMGIGEPLANVEAVLRAIRTINADWGLNIAARRISVSTCGLIAGIRRLAEAGLQVHLAVSLHAPTDDLRRKLMPHAPRATIAEIMSAAQQYALRTTRKVTLEYVLIDQVNDSVEQAEQLSRLARGFPLMVNLIPFNAVSHCPDLRPPTAGRVRAFVDTLNRAGVEACLRQRRGADVDAACGQMRLRLEEGGQGGDCPAD